MKTTYETTFWVKIYASGPIEIAKQVIRENVLEKGLCVTIEPTTFIYTGGEEQGYVIGLINYPRFPTTRNVILKRANKLAKQLLRATHQMSVLVMTPFDTLWITLPKKKANNSCH
jgi:hypothetical protein